MFEGVGMLPVHLPNPALGEGFPVAAQSLMLLFGVALIGHGSRLSPGDSRRIENRHTATRKELTPLAERTSLLSRSDSQVPSSRPWLRQGDLRKSYRRRPEG